MRQPQGRNLPLSLPRRFVCDILHFAQKVPTVPVQRTMNVAAVLAARRAALPRPSWAAIFTKAYAFVAAARPELRRAYMTIPWPRLYEHPINVASIAIERQLGEETAVLSAHVCNPEKKGLQELDAALRRFKEAPIQSVGGFRRVLQIGRYPRPLRRLLWWFGLNGIGRKRAHFFGTFGVSVYSGLGAASLHPLSPLTTTLNYGVIGDDGTVDVRIIYDHRVMDGATVARALADLERILNCEILAELRYFQKLDAA